jgi:hypothetical protein
MKLSPSPKHEATARTAFTLVELLVVIAIIIVLVSLLMVGVFKALDTAYEAQTRTDVTQLAVAVQAFQTHYSVPYIPSRIILCENPANYFVGGNPANGYLTPLHQDSLDYLQRVFPSIARPTLATSVWASTGIDWNGDGVIADGAISLSVYPSATPVVCNGAALEGEQCLVFFTGGIPSQATGTMVGFSTDPTNPAVGANRVPPFFDFRSNRLQVIAGTAPSFPSYQDGYGKTPYAYFSSYKSSNGYNRYVYISNPYLPLVPGSPITSDCQALQNYGANGTAVFPYCQAGMGSVTSPPGPAVGPPAYLNPQSYQIISAGKDNVFGSGTVVQGYPGYVTTNQIWVSNFLWTPGNAGAFYPQGQKLPSPQGQTGSGYDDVANFYDRLLGVPTQ